MCSFNFVFNFLLVCPTYDTSQSFKQSAPILLNLNKFAKIIEASIAYNVIGPVQCRCNHLRDALDINKRNKHKFFLNSMFSQNHSVRFLCINLSFQFRVKKFFKSYVNFIKNNIKREAIVL